MSRLSVTSRPENRRGRIYTDSKGEQFSEAPNKGLMQEIATRENAQDFLQLLNWLPNPDPVLLGTGKSLAAFTELLYDAHVGGAVAARKAATLSQEWTLDTTGMADEDLWTVELCRQALEHLKVRRLMSDFLNAPLYGNQPCEIVWDYLQAIDNAFLPDKVEAKPIDWFAFDLDNNLLFRDKVAQLFGMAGGVKLPERKFLVPRSNPSFDNPYGEAALSRCYWPVIFKRGALKFWVTYVEKFGMPYLIQYFEEAVYKTDADVLKLVADLDAMAQDGVFALPKRGGELHVETGGPQAKADVYKALIQECNAEISKAILGHGAAMDSTSGKLGNEDMAQLASAEVTDGDKQLVENEMNVLIGYMYDYNWPVKVRPKFILYEEQDVDLELANRDAILAEKLGVRFRKTGISNRFDIPEEDFEIADDPDAIPDDQTAAGIAAKAAGDVTAKLIASGEGAAVEGAPAGSEAEDDPIAKAAGELAANFAEAMKKAMGPACPDCGGHHFAEPRPAADFADQEVIDGLFAKLTPAQLQAQTERMVSLIFSEMDKDGATYESIFAGLVKGMPNMNTADLEAVLGRTFFIAETVGRQSVASEIEAGAKTTEG